MRSCWTAAVCFTTIAFACLPFTSAAQTSLSYQPRLNRQEGLRPEFNGKPQYEVRGIFGSEGSPIGSADSDLKVSFFIPPDASLLSIEAQELQKSRNYFMVPNLPLPGASPGHWATFAPWPVSEVLAKVPLTPSQLGVLVSLKLPNVPNVFAPALFYTGQAPSRVTVYNIFFSSDKAVTNVKCTVLDKNGLRQPPGGAAYTCNLPQKQTFLPSGVTTRFELNATSLPTGLVTVTIVGDYKSDESGDALRAVFHIFHQPQVTIR